MRECLLCLKLLSGKRLVTINNLIEAYYKLRQHGSAFNESVSYSKSVDYFKNEGKME